MMANKPLTIFTFSVFGVWMGRYNADILHEEDELF